MNLINHIHKISDKVRSGSLLIMIHSKINSLTRCWYAIEFICVRWNLKSPVNENHVVAPWIDLLASSITHCDFADRLLTEKIFCNWGKHIDWCMCWRLVVALGTVSLTSIYLRSSLFPAVSVTYQCSQWMVIQCGQMLLFQNLQGPDLCSMIMLEHNSERFADRLISIIPLNNSHYGVSTGMYMSDHLAFVPLHQHDNLDINLRSACRFCFK